MPPRIGSFPATCRWDLRVRSSTSAVRWAPSSSGCAARRAHTCAGVDFKDLSAAPSLAQVEFHCGLFYEADLAPDRFDLVTMWHFLEHDYDPLRSLETARRVLKPEGRLVIEVPRLDSRTFRWFGNRWPGLQAPQHTVLFDRDTLLRAVRKSGLEVVDYLPYGAFPAYFYLFTGAAFRLAQGAWPEPGQGDLPLLRWTDPAPAAAAVRKTTEPGNADGGLQEGAMKALALGIISLVLMTLTAVAMLPLGVVTLFRARRLYARIATLLSRCILRLHGVRMRVHQQRLPLPAANKRGGVSTHPDRLRVESHVESGPLHPRCPGSAEHPLLPEWLPAQVDPAGLHRVDDGHVLHRASGSAGRTADAFSPGPARSCGGPANRST